MPVIEKPPDFYSALGLARNALETDIKKAFRQAAIRYHPDKHPEQSEEAEAKFKEITAAYEVLSDPKKRRQYDQQVDASSSSSSHHHHLHKSGPSGASPAPSSTLGGSPSLFTGYHHQPPSVSRPTASARASDAHKSRSAPSSTSSSSFSGAPSTTGSTIPPSTSGGIPSASTTSAFPSSIPHPSASTATATTTAGGAAPTTSTSTSTSAAAAAAAASAAASSPFSSAPSATSAASASSSGTAPAASSAAGATAAAAASSGPASTSSFTTSSTSSTTTSSATSSSSSGSSIADDLFAQYFAGKTTKPAFRPPTRSASSDPTPKQVPPVEYLLELTLEELYSGVTKRMKISRHRAPEDSSGKTASSTSTPANGSTGTSSSSSSSSTSSRSSPPPPPPAASSASSTPSSSSSSPVAASSTSSSSTAAPSTGATGTSPPSSTTSTSAASFSSASSGSTTPNLGPAASASAASASASSAGGGGGGGTIEHTHVVIQVKPGWRKGTRIVYQGQGDQSPGLPPGDIVFVIGEKPHSRFTREGDHLFYTHSLPLKDALLGPIFHVTTLDKRSLTVDCRSDSVCVSPSFIKVVPGQGMPMKSDPTRHGDLHVKFDVQFPTHRLTEEQRAKLAEIL